MEKLKITIIARVESVTEKINKVGRSFYSYRLKDCNNFNLYAISNDQYDVNEFVHVTVDVGYDDEIRYSAFIDNNNVCADVYALKKAETIEKATNNK